MNWTNRLAAATAVFAVTAAGCASRVAYETVEFEAPSPPDPALEPILAGVERVGVLSITNIAPVREFDVEKVMGRLADTVGRGLRRIPEATVVTQDEIRWHFNYATFDSVSLLSPAMRARLRDELNLDAMVYVELNKLQAQVTPVSPTPYGNMSSSPGLDLSVVLQVTLFNLHTDKVWRQDRGEQRNWEPISVQPFGGGNQSERQLLATLASPLRQFLSRVAPPPRRQARRFEVSGN